MKQISSNRIRSEIKKASSGGNSLGTFSSYAELIQKYPNKNNKPKKDKNKDDLLEVVFNTDSFAFVDDGVNPIVQYHYNKKSQWVEVSGGTSGGGIPDAPLDGKLYGRQLAKWAEVASIADDRNKGYFTSEEALNTAFPPTSPDLKGGDFAFVDDEYGVFIYDYTPVRKRWVMDSSANWVSKEMLEQGIMVVSSGALEPKQSDLRLRKNGHKILMEMYDNNSWTLITAIGSILTDAYYLKSDDFGSMVGITDISNQGDYYNIFRRDIYGDNGNTVIGNEFGSMQRPLCLSVDSKDGAQIAYPSEKVVLNVQTVDNIIKDVGTYVIKYIPTSDVEFSQAEFNVLETTKARMFVKDVITGEVCYESASRRDAMDDGGNLIFDEKTKATTGVVLAKFPRIGFMSKGREYEISMQIFSGKMMGSDKFIRFSIHGESWSEEIIATQEWISEQPFYHNQSLQETLTTGNIMSADTNIRLLGVDASETFDITKTNVTYTNNGHIDFDEKGWNFDSIYLGTITPKEQSALSIHLNPATNISPKLLAFCIDSVPDKPINLPDNIQFDVTELDGSVTKAPYKYTINTQSNPTSGIFSIHLDGREIKNIAMTIRKTTMGGYPNFSGWGYMKIIKGYSGNFANLFEKVDGKMVLNPSLIIGSAPQVVVWDDIKNKPEILPEVSDNKLYSRSKGKWVESAKQNVFAFGDKYQWYKGEFATYNSKLYRTVADTTANPETTITKYTSVMIPNDFPDRVKTTVENPKIQMFVPFVPKDNCKLIGIRYNITLDTAVQDCYICLAEREEVGGVKLARIKFMEKINIISGNNEYDLALPPDVIKGKAYELALFIPSLTPISVGNNDMSIAENSAMKVGLIDKDRYSSAYDCVKIGDDITPRIDGTYMYHQGTWYNGLLSLSPVLQYPKYSDWYEVVGGSSGDVTWDNISGKPDNILTETLLETTPHNKIPLAFPSKDNKTKGKIFTVNPSDSSEFDLVKCENAPLEDGTPIPSAIFGSAGIKTNIKSGYKDIGMTVRLEDYSIRPTVPDETPLDLVKCAYDCKTGDFDSVIDSISISLAIPATVTIKINRLEIGTKVCEEGYAIFKVPDIVVKPNSDLRIEIITNVPNAVKGKSVTVDEITTNTPYVEVTMARVEVDTVSSFKKARHINLAPEQNDDGSWTKLVDNLWLNTVTVPEETRVTYGVEALKTLKFTTNKPENIPTSGILEGFSEPRLIYTSTSNLVDTDFIEIMFDNLNTDLDERLIELYLDTYVTETRSKVVPMLFNTNTIYLIDPISEKQIDAKITIGDCGAMNQELHIVAKIKKNQKAVIHIGGGNNLYDANALVYVAEHKLPISTPMFNVGATISGKFIPQDCKVSLYSNKVKYSKNSLVVDNNIIYQAYSETINNPTYASNRAYEDEFVASNKKFTNTPELPQLIMAQRLNVYSNDCELFGIKVDTMGNKLENAFAVVYENKEGINEEATEMKIVAIQRIEMVNPNSSIEFDTPVKLSKNKSYSYGITVVGKGGYTFGINEGCAYNSNPIMTNGTRLNMDSAKIYATNAKDRIVPEIGVVVKNWNSSLRGSMFAITPLIFGTGSDWTKIINTSHLNPSIGDNIDVLIEDPKEITVPVDIKDVAFTVPASVDSPNLEEVDGINCIRTWGTVVAEGDELVFHIPIVKNTKGEESTFYLKFKRLDGRKNIIETRAIKVGDGTDIIPSAVVNFTDDGNNECTITIKTTIQTDKLDVIFRFGNDISDSICNVFRNGMSDAVIENLFINNKLNPKLGGWTSSLNLKKKENISVIFEELDFYKISENMKIPASGGIAINSPSGNIEVPTITDIDNVCRVKFTKCNVIAGEGFRISSPKWKTGTPIKLLMNIVGDGTSPIGINPLRMRIRGNGTDAVFTSKIIEKSEFNKTLELSLTMTIEDLRLELGEGNNFTNSELTLYCEYDSTDKKIIEKTEGLFTDYTINPKLVKGDWNPKVVDLTNDSKDNINIKLSTEELWKHLDMPECGLKPVEVSAVMDETSTFINYGDDCIFDTPTKSLDIAFPIPQEFVGKSPFNLELTIQSDDLKAMIVNLDDFSINENPNVIKSIRTESNTKIITFEKISAVDGVTIAIKSKELSAIKTSLSKCLTYFITFRDGNTSKLVPLFDGKHKISSEFTSGGGTGSIVTDSTVNGNILVDNAEVIVYEHPTTHPATMITQDKDNRFVTDVEKADWNNMFRVEKLVNMTNLNDTDIRAGYYANCKGVIANGFPEDNKDFSVWVGVNEQQAVRKSDGKSFSRTYTGGGNWNSWKENAVVADTLTTTGGYTWSSSKIANELAKIASNKVIIYVSSTGDDTKDGKSVGSAVKTLAVGLSKIPSYSLGNDKHQLLLVGDFTNEDLTLRFKTNVEIKPVTTSVKSKIKSIQMDSCNDINISYLEVVGTNQSIISTSTNCIFNNLLSTSKQVSPQTNFLYFINSSGMYFDTSSVSNKDCIVRGDTSVVVLNNITGTSNLSVYDIRYGSTVSVANSPTINSVARTIDNDSIDLGAVRKLPVIDDGTVSTTKVYSSDKVSTLLSARQSVTDATLTTYNKEVVKAINEVQNGLRCVTGASIQYEPFGESLTTTKQITQDQIQRHFDANKSKSGFLSQDTTNPFAFYPDLPPIPNGKYALWLGENNWYYKVGDGTNSGWTTMNSFTKNNFNFTPVYVAMGISKGYATIQYTDGIVASKPSINDVTASDTYVYSSNKVNSLISKVIPSLEFIDGDKSDIDFKTCFTRSGIFRVFNAKTNMPPSYDSKNSDFYCSVYYTTEKWIKIMASDVRSSRMFTISMVNNTWNDWMEVGVLDDASTLATKTWSAKKTSDELKLKEDLKIVSNPAASEIGTVFNAKTENYKVGFTNLISANLPVGINSGNNLVVVEGLVFGGKQRQYLYDMNSTKSWLRIYNGTTWLNWAVVTS